MSESVRPPILHGFGPGISHERIFAEEACLLLIDNGVDYEQFIDGCAVTTKVTDRVDMQPTNDDQCVAMRLRAVPVMGMRESALIQLETPSPYLAILLEYGEFDGDDADIEHDESFDWHHYALAVINRDRLNDAAILDPATGQDLTPENLMLAQSYLDQVRSEMRNARVDELIPTQALDADFLKQTLQAKYATKFESSEFYSPIKCLDCETGNLDCSHNQFKLC